MIVLSLVDCTEENSGHKEILSCIIKYSLFPLPLSYSTIIVFIWPLEHFFWEEEVLA